MIRRAALVLGLVLSGAAGAQEITVTPIDPAAPAAEAPVTPPTPVVTFEETNTAVSEGVGGTVRVLDKISGVVTDLTLVPNAPQTVGLITITLSDCRYPTDNPAGDAFGHLLVTYRDQPLPVFDGWMIASAPALNAMDHPRYDVWMLRCTMP